MLNSSASSCSVTTQEPARSGDKTGCLHICNVNIQQQCATVYRTHEPVYALEENAVAFCEWYRPFDLIPYLEKFINYTTSDLAAYYAAEIISIIQVMPQHFKNGNIRLLDDLMNHGLHSFKKKFSDLDDFQKYLFIMLEMVLKLQYYKYSNGQFFGYSRCSRLMQSNGHCTGPTKNGMRITWPEIVEFGNFMNWLIAVV